MKMLRALVLGLASLAVVAGAQERAASPRERLLMDRGWRFAFGHPHDTTRDFGHGTGYFSYLAKTGFGDGPAAREFDDRAWRTLDLPHDWAVEVPFSKEGSTSHGFKAVGRSFPETSVGWYRRAFRVPQADLGRRIAIVLDGAYRDAAVWVNGFYLGREASGYLGARYDLTDYLRYGEDNVVAVRVDATMEEGWFYEGAGIYRHVWLTKTAPVHVAHDGTFVASQVAEGAATVTARVAVANDGASDAAVTVEQTVVDGAGGAVASGRAELTRVPAGREAESETAIPVAAPRLWSPETPHLYTLVTTLRQGGAVVDRYETTFGIRTIAFDPDRGFLLNGRKYVLKGTNNHQDHAGVGAALPDALQRFRITRLKEMGSNAYRASHNPPTPELLDACDRLGMLVIDEHRLMGSSPVHLDELARLVRRDRNHPSVVLWSLGNEEWAIEGNVTGARIAATMQAEAHRLDPTRPTTVALSGGRDPQGISGAAEVMGFNYVGNGSPDEHRARMPRQPGVGTEETTTQGTRGIYVDDPARARLSPQADGSSKGNCEFGWQYYAARPHLAGLFYWTGFDYRGEPTPYVWPAIASQFGILDLAGFPKDCFHYLRAWWTDADVLHVSPHWTWPGREGRDVVVRVDGNADEVSLALNGRPLGRRAMPRNGHLEWTVPYRPGVLEARGFARGRQVSRARVETAGPPAAVRLTADRTTLAADGEDVAALTAQVVDAKGRAVPTAETPLTFAVEGGGRILGVGNGDPGSHEPDRFVDALALVGVRDWRGRIVPAGTTSPAEAGALAPMTVLGAWRAVTPKPGEIYDLYAAFPLEAPPGAADVRLVVPRLGARTTVLVNGREVARELDTSRAGPDLRLDPAVLVAGDNRLRLLVVPQEGPRNLIPETTHLGTVAVRTPAAPWSRRAFGGLAQVLLQAPRATGPLRVVAAADGLAPAVLDLTLAPAEARAELPLP
ncbi:MAG: beta-galactosidase GalA [Vicinamibacteria bacterium]